MSTKSFRDIEELFGTVLLLVEKSNQKVISIDGKDGSGKTTLARILAKRIKASHIEVDKFIDENRGGFLEYVKYDLLKDKIKAVHSEGNICIVEGDCILQILERIRVTPKLKIYVKKIKPDGFWYDGHCYFDANKTAEQVIHERREEVLALAEFEGKKIEPENLKRERLFEEIIKYHYNYRPHESCDLIFERILK